MKLLHSLHSRRVLEEIYHDIDAKANNVQESAPLFRGIWCVSSSQVYINDRNARNHDECKQVNIAV